MRRSLLAISLLVSAPLAVAAPADTKTDAAKTATTNAPKPLARLITVQGSTSDTWLLDPQAFVFWCHRTVDDVGYLPWFGEFADVASDDRARITQALDVCMKRRQARHKQIGIALPSALAVKVAMGQSLTSNERWMLGFVDHVVIDDALVKAAGEVKKLSLLLERPELRGINEYWVMPGPDRRACTWLGVVGSMRTTDLLRLRVSPNCDTALPKQLPTLSNLTALTASATLALRWQKQLPALEHFQVASDDQTGPTEFAIGAPIVFLPKMTRVRLGAGDFAILKGPPQPQVRELVIDAPALTLRHIEQITSSTTFPNITALEVTTSRLAPELQRALWKGLRLRQLGKLTLRANGTMGRREADILIDSAVLRQLHTLEFEGIVPDAEALELLGNTRHISALKTLALRMASIDSKKLTVLTKARALHPIALDLRQNPLGGATLSALSNAPLLFSLQELLLSGSQIDDAGARALASVYGLVQLVYLDLADNKFTAAGLKTLLRSGSFANLIWLDVFTGDKPDDKLLCSILQGARPLPAEPCLALGMFRRN